MSMYNVFMLQSFSQVFPLVCIILIGYLLKHFKFLNSDDGSTLLKTIFYTGTPALIFISILKVNIDPSLLILALIAPLIVTISALLMYGLRISALANVPRKTFGAMFCAATIMNTGFLFPFVEKLYGSEGLAKLAIIDGFNGLIVFSLVYAIAAHYGADTPQKNFIIKKLLIAPPIWALAAGLLCKSLSITPHALILDTLAIIAKIVSPAILLALGLKFTPKITMPKLLPIPILVRIVLGSAIGLLIVSVLDLSGVTRSVVLLASIAPSGFNTITFADMEKLDTKFAASAVSIALLFAIILFPLIIHYL